MLGLGVSIWTGGGSAGWPSLALDFLSGILDPRIQFTRASTATRVNAAGLLETVAANRPRFDYDPVTLACRGLLIEEQRANLFTESEFRNGLADALVKNGAVTAAAFPGFAGGIAFGAGTDSWAYKQIAATSGTAYTLSVFVRMDDGGAPGLAGGGAADGANIFALVLQGNASSPLSCPVVNMGGGLYRVSSTLTATSSGTGNFGVVKYASNSSRTFKVTGYQIEVGAFPTSYIPTTTAQVTRAADVALISPVSPWYAATAGTLHARGAILTAAGDYRPAASIDLSTSDRMEIGVNAQAVPYMYEPATGVPLMAPAVTPLTPFSLALAYDTQMAFAARGALWTPSGITRTSGNAPARLRIGCNADNQAFNGWVQSLRYWRRKFSAAELQALTA